MQRHPARSAVKLKHYFLPTEPLKSDVEYVPRYYFEAKIDFADVRSGLRKTCSVSKAVDIFPIEEDALWTEDMVWAVNPAMIRTQVPQHARLSVLPEFVDAPAVGKAETQFLRYLLRYIKIRVYRNFALNVYSGPGENLEEFTARCVDLLTGSFRQDLDKLYEVFDRSLEQIKGKYLKTREWTDFDPPQRALQLNSTLRRSSERIAQLFLRADLNLKPITPGPSWSSPVKLDLEERLHLLEGNAHHAIGQLLGAWQDKVRNIDEYIVHPNLKDIDLIRTCILWMPDSELK